MKPAADVRPGDLIAISVELIVQIKAEGGRTRLVRVQKIELDEDTDAKILYLEVADR